MFEMVYKKLGMMCNRRLWKTLTKTKMV